MEECRSLAAFFLLPSLPLVAPCRPGVAAQAVKRCRRRLLDVLLSVYLYIRIYWYIDICIYVYLFIGLSFCCPPFVALIFGAWFRGQYACSSLSFLPFGVGVFLGGSWTFQLLLSLFCPWVYSPLRRSPFLFVGLRACPLSMPPCHVWHSCMLPCLRPSPCGLWWAPL